MTLSPTGPVNESVASFDATTDVLNYDIRFEEETEITGYMSLHAWFSVLGYDDADLFFTVKKLGQDGQELPVSVIDEPHPGTWCKQRLSMRALDEKASTETRPVQSFLKIEKLTEGEAVRLDICFVPTSRIWHKGETLRLQIAGRYIRDENWFETLVWLPDNQGTQRVHTGGAHSSYLTIPVIPPRYQSGDYVLR